MLIGREKFKDHPDSLKNFVKKVFERAFSASEPKPDALELSREISRILKCKELELHLRSITYNAQKKYFRDSDDNYYNSDGVGFANYIKPLFAHVDLGMS